MKALSSILVLYLISFPIAAQAPRKVAPLIEKCTFEFARNLVEQQAGESKTIDAPNKRIEVLLAAADFLWKSDEASARKHFAEAFEVADSSHRENGFASEKSDSPTSVRMPDQRFEVIRRISKHDIAWSKKLSEKILKDFEEADKSKRDDWDKDSEIRSLLGMAREVAKKDPQASLNLFRRAMRYPLSQLLSQIWYGELIVLAGIDQKISDQIFGELLTANANAPISNLFLISDYPFGKGNIIDLNISLSQDIPQGFIPNLMLQRQFLILILQRAQNYKPSDTTESLKTWEYPEYVRFFHLMRTYETTVKERFPDLSNNWISAQNQLYAYFSEAERKGLSARDKRQEGQSGGFEEVLEKAEKEDSNGKLEEYTVFRLINTCKKEEHFAKAESWLDKIADEKLRDSLRLYFNYMRSKKAIEEKRFDDAKKAADKISKLEYRSLLLLEIAESKLKQKISKNEALDILLEVYQIAVKADDSIAKTQTLFALSIIYERIDHQNALNCLSEAVKSKNSLDPEKDVSNSHLSISIKGKYFSSYSSLDSPGFDVQSVFNELSKKDFKNTLNYANLFSDKYFRAMAVIAIAKNCDAAPISKPAKAAK